MSKLAPFMLDLPIPKWFEKRKKETQFIRSNMCAKRFRVEHDAAEKILSLITDHEGLYEEQRRFAKPPFESVFLQFDAHERVYDSEIGLLVSSNECVLVAEGFGEAYWGRYKVKIEPGGLDLIDQRPDVPLAVEEQALKTLIVKIVAMAEVLFLLMHKPGVVRSTAVAAKQKLVKGKLRPYRAHTVLNIDLSPKEIQKRIVANGSRGPNREHEVRGAWVHLRMDRECVHDWHRAEVKPNMPERWFCPCCKAIRVWRREHVRGSHELGNKFHTYNVRA